VMTRRGVFGRSVGLVGALVVGVSLALSGTTRADEPKEAGLEIYFVDVQGGAATLVVTPERETILIDCGWPDQFHRSGGAIAKVLEEIGSDRINHLVTTHWHLDHWGGVEDLARRVEIERYWDRGLPEDGEPGLVFPDGPKDDDPQAIAYRAASKGKRTILRAGDSLPLRGDVSAVVLAASGKVASPAKDAPENPLCASAPAAHPEDRSDNAQSVVLKIRAGKFDFLVCGDLTWNIEKNLVCPHDLIGKIDLYQVTHHGLAISNNPILLQTIEPLVTVMTNGPRKGGEAETVHRLRTIPSIQASYQLHRNAQTGDEGNTDPSLIVNDSPEGGRYLHVSVSPDGSTFRVRMGADGPERTFESR